MPGSFERCIPVTLDYEGGNDDDPHDSGGRTSRGITEREWLAYRRAHTQLVLPEDVWKAPQGAILDIYRTQYWDSVRGSEWPTGLDLCVFDAGVNSGIGKALAWARSTLGQGQGTFVLLAATASHEKNQKALIDRYQARRLSFLEALRSWRYFGKGWARRVAGIDAIASKWILAEQGHPPEIIASELQKQAASSANKSKTAGSGAIVAPAAPAAHVTKVSHDQLWVYGVDALLILVAALAAGALLWYAYKHWVRSKAFQEQAK